MAAGDVTILGPYKYSETGTMETALEALVHTDAASDTTFSVCSPKQFWVVNIEGA